MNHFLEKILSFGDRIAVIFENNRYTYHDLGQLIEAYGNDMGKIPEGDVVILNTDMTFHGLACFFALFNNRNIIVPVTFENEELLIRSELSGAKFVVTPKAKNILIKNLLNTTSNHLYEEIRGERHSGLVLFSSGITGKPKGMVHDLDKLMQPFLEKKTKNANFMALLMFDHIGGLNTAMSAIFFGATLTIPIKREPFHICEAIEKHKVNVLPASPTFLNLILLSGAHEKFDLSSLKVITYGTEPMPSGLLLKLNQAFPGIRFLQTFGTSETGISQISSKSSASTRIKFDDPRTEYKVVNGELWIKSQTTIKGYLNADMDQFTPDGWFMTGDLAEIDNEGYFVLTGRKNDLINVGGLKVYPQEVESAIMEFPGIADCLVMGESNPITGNIVIAFVQVTQNLNTKLITDSLRKFLLSKLERFKVPVKIKIVEKIEHNNRFKKIRTINNLKPD